MSLSNAIKLKSTYEAWVKNIRGESGSAGEGFTTGTTSSNAKYSVGPFVSAAKATSTTNPFTAPFKFFSSRRSNAAATDTSTCVHPIDIPAGGSLLDEASSGAKAAADVVSSSISNKQITPYGIPLHLWKVIFQFMLTSMNVLCWLIPLHSKKMSENKFGLSMANAFSGGVFLSLAFGHLLPECAQGFEGYNEATPFILVMVGYLVIFFVEKVAFDAHDILHEMEHSSSQQQLHQDDNGDSSKEQNGEKGNVVTVDSANNGINSGRSAVILLGALAVHSILEMAALGLADTFGDCALLTLSIALHQPAESIALLVAFLKSGMPKVQIIQFLSAFSAMGPIGVAVGMAVNEFASPIVDASMLAIVAGTFIYVGATEIIPEEWEDSKYKWQKFFALMSGVISILVITQYTMSLGI